MPARGPVVEPLDVMIRESRRTIDDLGAEIERLQRETERLLSAMATTEEPRAGVVPS